MRHPRPIPYRPVLRRRPPRPSSRIAGFFPWSLPFTRRRPVDVAVQYIRWGGLPIPISEAHTFASAMSLARRPGPITVRRRPRRNAWPSCSESRTSPSRGTVSAPVRTRASSARSVHADPGDMFAWAGATASWPNRTDPGGSRGLDDYFTRDFASNIGAEIMGRNKFSPQRGPWADHEWQGWWGDEPPFHTPVFVMTHHERPSFTLSDTTFHFVNGDPAAVLERAREAAQGKDVRLGGGATTIRQFLDADLVDTLHVAVSQVELGARIAPLGVARRAARPVPPRRRAEPERRDAPPVLAAMTPRHR